MKFVTFAIKIIKFSSKNRQIFFKKSSNFPEKVVKCSCKDYQILQKSLDFPEKIGKSSWKNRQFSLKKLSNFFCKNGYVFSQRAINLLPKIVKFFSKIVKFFGKNYELFLQKSTKFVRHIWNYLIIIIIDVIKKIKGWKSEGSFAIPALLLR